MKRRVQVQACERVVQVWMSGRSMRAQDSREQQQQYSLLPSPTPYSLVPTPYSLPHTGAAEGEEAGFSQPRPASHVGAEKSLATAYRRAYQVSPGISCTPWDGGRDGDMQTDADTVLYR